MPIKLMPHRGKRYDNQELVTGFYWFIEEHYDSRLSKRHFIKSLNNGIDYEVIEDTIEFYTGYLDSKDIPIFVGDRISFIDEFDDFGEPMEQFGIITYDEEQDYVYLEVEPNPSNFNRGDVIEMIDLVETYGGTIV